MRKNERGYFDGFVAAYVAVAALIVLAFLAYPIYLVAVYQHDVTRVCHVEDKDRASKQGGGSDMRVYTTDCGNLSVSDATFKGNFHSSDTYREIKTGKTYRFETIGFRIPIAGAFPNILSAEEVG